MTLQYKPDFTAAKTAWNHYWNKELYQGRPLVLGSSPRAGGYVMNWESDNPYSLRYYHAVHGLWAEQLRRIECMFESIVYEAEAIPFWSPDFGPDQCAAFLGGQLAFSEGSLETNWVHPVVEDWEQFDIHLDWNNPTLQSVQQYARKLAEHAHGRYLVGTCDFHSNGDTLSALRSPERLCMDFMDCPELVGRAMSQVRELYQPVYDAIYEASGSTSATGTIGWLPFWCEGKFATIQCDFICMISPAIFREYIMPALSEEAAFLDRCVYHLDGPGALRHLDQIVAIPDIDAIQWVPGAGQAPMHTWLDVLKRIQKAGKGLIIYGVGPDEVKLLHRELNPVGVVYEVGTQPKGVIEDLCKWLKSHT